MDIFVRSLVFILGLFVVVLTIFSALSTFVLTRAARSQLNRVVFGIMRRIFDFILRFTRTYEQRDAIMAYYSPLSLMMLVPVWYALILAGYAAMYWSLGVGNWFADVRFSGSSLLTLGFATSEIPVVTVLSFSEALIGLIMVALLMAYLPTMYAAFSRREQAVSMLEVRAGNPPSVLEMLLRFNRIHGLEKLGDYWKLWEAWFADIEESHTTLPALVFFRSPRSDNSWITASGVILDTAAITLSAVDIPAESSASLSIRAGFLALRHIADYFDIPSPKNPRYPVNPISIKREEFDELLAKLEQAGVPLKADREKAWIDFAGWRVNYDQVLLVLCALVMAPEAPWSSDRAPKHRKSPLLIFKKKQKN
jgi:ABC-type multidrug transport system fused ATPase/permease subunit